MTKYKALFMDIDGTILKADHTYHPLTKQAILQAKDLGMEVFLATGRPIHEIYNLAEELQVDSLIGYNGGQAIHKGQILVQVTFPPSIVWEFIEIANQYGHDIVFYTDKKNYFTSFDNPTTKRFIELIQLKQNKLFHQDVADQILGGTLIGVPEEHVELYQVHPAFYLSQVNVPSLRNCYDIICTKNNKGQAVAQVIKQLGISSDEVIAFGDGMNDKEMLSIAGVSFAMENANEKLFSYATYRTKSVNEAGVYHGLKRLGIID